MPKYVRRSQINFGKTDAKSALVSRDLESKKLFLQAFAPPKESDIASIRNGDRFLFYGTKGSGKTALLRYIMEKEREDNNITSVIVFSEDLTNQDKIRLSSPIDFDGVEKPEIGDEIDVRDMWRIFIVKELCKLLASNSMMFDNCKDAEKLISIISNIFEENKLNTLDKILAGVKTGVLKLKGKAHEFAEIEAIFNWENGSGEQTINYSRFSELVIDRICKFNYPRDVKYILYFDELNLSMIGHKQHRRDSILIRDLIISIGNLNRIFVEKNIPIFLYAAVRVEIAKAISISRNEIDKYLVDHGYKLQWHGGYEVKKYPIFNIIESRIVAIEKSISGISNKPEQIWDEYFSRDIYGVHPKKFLAEITWCNPRDIVNIFNLASKVEMHKSVYDTAVFASVLEEYSEIAWTERAEELNSEHNMAVVQSFKRFLTGGFKHFKIEQFEQRIEGMAKNDSNLMKVLKTLGAERICRDLYHVGIVGQSMTAGSYTSPDGTIKRNIHETWFYRDYREFDSSQWLIVHRALYPCLKVARMRAEDFGNDPRYD